MWWPDTTRAVRAATLAAAVLGLGACGFSPVYAPGGPALGLRGAVSVDAGDTVLGFRLRTALEDALGPAAGNGQYRLDIALEVEEAGVALTQAGATTRFTFAAVARYRLVEREGERLLTEGSVDNFTSYSTTDSTVATQAARDDAELRLGRILADQILARIEAAVAAGR